MDSLQHIAFAVWETLVRVVSYPIDATQRLYWPYLVSSIAVAFIAFMIWRRRQGTRGSLGNFVRFLFPPEIWKHRSTWVDVRYFIPHQMVRIWIYVNMVLFLSVPFTRWTSSMLETLTGAPPESSEATMTVALAYTVASMVIVDFLSYVVHYAQHKVPLLWKFHRVHHSAEVLNPLSNYREHPVDNFIYAVFVALGVGFVGGVFTRVTGSVPSDVQILGINGLVFFFNVGGYHLRHSHVWVRWPGKLAYVFGCPAHHQIHHSCLPQHRDRNMAFMFPIWDVLFGTWCLPEKQPEMQFGIGDGSEPEYDGFFRIYLRPFRDLLGRSRD